MRVVLVHGMGRTPGSLWRLRRFLMGHGHEVTLVGYSATVERFDRIVARLHHRLGAVATSGPRYAVVAHSLGGVVTRAALAGIAPAPEQLVFLGTPARVPRLATRLATRWSYQLLNGECGQLLAREEFFATLPTPAAPLITVAGTVGPRGRWSPFGDAVNDCVVAADEIAVAGAHNVRVPAMHTFLMNHPATREIIRQALDG